MIQTRLLPAKRTALMFASGSAAVQSANVELVLDTGMPVTAVHVAPLSIERST